MGFIRYFGRLLLVDAASLPQRVLDTVSIRGFEEYDCFGEQAPGDTTSSEREICTNQRFNR